MPNDQIKTPTLNEQQIPLRRLSPCLAWARVESIELGVSRAETQFKHKGDKKCQLITRS